MMKKDYYKRKLPHWQPPHSDFFITYRLAGSIPANVIEQLVWKYPGNYKKDKQHFSNNEQYFAEWKNALETMNHGPNWLVIPEIAEIVLNSLKFKNNQDYILWAANIMSNHVHCVLRTKASPSLDKILQNHKKFTAVQSNKVLNRAGKFWAEESFDTLMRNSNQLHNCIIYCINNPVKAGLVNKWTDWAWTYLNPSMQNLFK